MRPRVILAVIVPLIAVLVLVREARLAQRLETLSAEKDHLVTERKATLNRLKDLETRFNELTAEAGATGSARDDTTLQRALARVTALETQLQNLSRRNNGGVPRLPTVPEYDPTRPPMPTDLAQAPTNAAPKRGWGPEQISGPPDTDRDGDIQTAWASREPDGGAEWLWADFEHPAELAQVRIRETFNPGAISKVTAVINGQQIVLWEGNAASGQAPRDFVVNAPSGINTQSVVVHLDTSRVSGWNEVDAIELVGADGSRQWASVVNASSSYADRSGTAAAIGDSPGRGVLLTEPFVVEPARRP
ncbi:MAG TPA: hypothetical protein VJW76_03935 [Verrucomicrobiae bacterium]|nr:hypothetical protein [Verrucomicrobiae bacterium]